jgi:hypothetical protein
MKLLEAEAKQPSDGRSRGATRARQRSRRHCFAFGLVAMAATLMPAKLPAAPRAQVDGPTPRLTLTIRVYNYAKVSAGKLRDARNEASRIIGDTGVETVWVECPTSRRVSLPGQGGGQQECSGEALGATVILRVLTRPDYDSATFNRQVLGYADGPGLASVLYDRVAALADADGHPNEAPVILGDAIAHEIGHLLLEPRAHSPTGIMRSQWDRAQLQLALTGRQRFTPEQSATIRAAMEARMKLSRSWRPGQNPREGDRPLTSLVEAASR